MGWTLKLVLGCMIMGFLGTVRAFDYRQGWGGVSGCLGVGLRRVPEGWSRVGGLI